MKITLNVIVIVFVLLIIMLSGCDSLPNAKPCDDNSQCPDGRACDTDGKCHVCGDNAGRVCCEGNTCEEGLVCYEGKCTLCGTVWERCCEGNICNDYCLECSSDGVCHTIEGYTASYSAGCGSRG